MLRRWRAAIGRGPRSVASATAVPTVIASMALVLVVASAPATAGDAGKAAPSATAAGDAGKAAPAAAGDAGKAKVALGAGPQKRRPPDFAEVESKLVVLGDGKRHFVVLQPFGGDSSDHVYYGDGKTFHAQRIIGAGSSGNGSSADDSFERSFWDPRYDARWKSTLGLKKGRYFVQCGERVTELSPLGQAEAAAMLASAAFEGVLWKHKAYALARDDSGRYYYVDRVREPPTSMSFRLWSGPRGAVKPMKMVNVVSDSAGDIFATKGGELRLVLDKKETTWIQRGKRSPLTFLPVEDNHVLIYGDLGAYAGQRLGTPCDDL